MIIDLGLAKRISDSQCLPQPNTFSIVEGKQVGLGTPRYAAPEQFSGDEITPASDIHALGKIADECFGGNPPRAWRRIIERATSSIPARRYPSVAAFIRAIQRRNILRTMTLIAARPEFIDRCDWSKFNANDIVRIVRQCGKLGVPMAALHLDECDFSQLSASDWSQVLVLRPDLADKFESIERDWSKDDESKDIEEFFQDSL